MKGLKNTKGVTYSAIIAALYVILCYFAYALGLSGGAVQVRVAEALTVLPFFTPYAVSGVTVGCFVSNILTGCLPWDIVFGTLATLLGAIGTRLLRKKSPCLAPVPPIISNVLIIPFVLQRVYGVGTPIHLLMLSIFAGEFISCGVLGLVLLRAVKPHANRLFGNQSK